MPDKTRKANEETGKSPDKLILSALSAWELEGVTGVSARSLTAAAGLPASAIHYHFGSLGHLLDAAQAAAVASARLWCAAQCGAIGPDARSPVMLGSLLAALVDDWCENQRGLAFAWREGLLAALRDPALTSWARRWDILWQEFFTQLCGQMGIAELATLTAWFFDGACALHLLRWRRPLDRAGLDELCGGWAAWTGGELASHGAWFALGQADAKQLALLPEPDDAVARAIAEAASEIVAEYGVAALTHRAVAARAGLTLGTVSYKYRTSSDLLQGAFEAIYRRMLADSPETRGEVLAITADEAIMSVERGIPARADLLGTDELLVAAARNPALHTFAAQLRYSRGRSSGRVLQAIVGAGRPISAVDGAILSTLFGGRSRAHHCTRRQGGGDFGSLFARLLGR